MSILDALKVQKASQKSVRELAMLPQNQIVRMAQQGMIPADVLPVVINEKARMAKESANMQAAMQQGQQPTVLEQAMQVNAQAEAPQMPQQQMPQQQMQQMQQMQQPQMQPPEQPQDAGIGSLPLDQMFQGQNFATGGIVAFEEGGLNEAGAEAGGTNKRYSSLADAIKDYQAQTQAARVLSPEEQALMDARKAGSFSKDDADRQMYMRLMQAGLGIAGGTSPFALTNIAQGAQPAMQGYMEDVGRQRAAKLDDLKTAADLARQQRAEKLEDIKGGIGLMKEQEDRLFRQKLSDSSQLGSKFVENYLAARREAGDQRSDATIKNEGFNTFFQQYNQALPRIMSQQAIAGGAQGLTAEEQERKRRSDARDNVSKRLENFASPEARQYRQLMKKDPVEAEAYKNKLMEEEFRVLGSKASAASSPTAAPQKRQKPDISSLTGAPPGATVGSFVEGRGWEVKTKDGKVAGYVQE